MTVPRTTEAKLLLTLLTPVDRYTTKLKAQLCEHIRCGDFTFDQVKRAHRLSDEELTGWYAIYLEKGARGLRVSSTYSHRRRAA